MGRDAHQCLGDWARHPSPLWDSPLYPIRDRGRVNTVGEPCAGKPHARFDEGWLARHLAGPAAYSTNLVVPTRGPSPAAASHAQAERSLEPLLGSSPGPDLLEGGFGCLMPKLWMHPPKLLTIHVTNAL